jgi:hypothetical protein
MYKLYKCITDFGVYNVYPIKATYSNERTAILLITSTGEELARLTVNIPNHEVYENENSFVDTNNVSWAEEFLLTNNLAVDLYLWAPSGFCTYPLYKFNLDKFYDYNEVLNYIESRRGTEERVSEELIKISKDTTKQRSKLKRFEINITDKNGNIVYQESVLAQSKTSAENKVRENYIKTLGVSNV